MRVTSPSVNRKFISTELRMLSLCPGFDKLRYNKLAYQFHMVSSQLSDLRKGHGWNAARRPGFGIAGRNATNGNNDPGKTGISRARSRSRPLRCGGDRPCRSGLCEALAKIHADSS